MPIEDLDIQTNYESTIRSQSEIEDLIGNPPGWLLRSGISMVAIVFSILLGGSYFFKYPDKLVGMGTLTSSSPPIEILSRTTGYIDQIHLKEGDIVEQGESIVFINNATDESQLNKLVGWIDKYKQIKDPKMYLNLSFIENLQLGTVQSEYASLQLRYQELQQTLKDGVVFQQINNISREISKIEKLNQSHEREISLYAQELELARTNFLRNKSLNEDGVLSDLEMEGIKTTFLQKERLMEGMNNVMIQNNIRIEQLQLEKLKLQEQRSNTIKKSQYTIAEILARINFSIENWNKTYIVKSPTKGKITFATNISISKNITAGQVIGYILPMENEQKYIQAILPGNNIGKVEKGQKTILKFEAFPYKEYGVVISSVGSISKMPEVDQDGKVLYQVKIPLEDNIITEYQDTIIYKPHLTALTEIITEDKSVLTRIFDQLLSLLNHMG